MEATNAIPVASAATVPGMSADDDKLGATATAPSAPGASEHAAKYEAIRQWFGADCSRMTVMAARKFEVPEVEVLRALTTTHPVTELQGEKFADIMQAIQPAGLVRIFVKSRAAIIEADGKLSEAKFSITGPFFNVDGGGLDMHIFHKEIAAAFAVEKRSHMDRDDRTYSVQFYDHQGDAAFKVFFWENFPNTPEPVIETFRATVEKFRA